MRDDVQAPRRNDPEESQKEAAGKRIKGRPAVREKVERPKGEAMRAPAAS
jgi:hypothetical protein